jgi:hypothetical protein
LINTQVANEEKTAEQTNLCFTHQKPLFAHYLQLAMLPMSFSHGELRILARNEPVNQLTQKAESDRSRLFALKAWFSKGLRRFGRCGASFSSEPVALDPREKVAKSRPGSER